MTSFTHRGFSGFAVERDGNHVVKWTIGKESCLKLKHSFIRQYGDYHEFNLDPIRAVEVFGYEHKDEKLSFKMPYVDMHSGYSTDNFGALERGVLESLFNRKTVETAGFKIAIKKEIDRILKDFTRDDFQDACGGLLRINADTKRCSDFYPNSYAHGDFGFANMFIDKLGNIYMIDYERAFIDSPLLDVATMSLSLMNSPHSKHHKNIEKKALRMFSHNLKQIEVIKKVKILSWIPFARDDNWRKEALRLLNV